MGPAKYGEFGIALSSIDLFAVFAGMALGVTATKYIAELRGKDPERAGRIIAVSTILASFGGGAAAIALFFLAPWAASHMLAAPQLTGPLRIGTLALAFSSLNGAQSGALYGFEAFRVVARLQAIMGVIDLPCIFGGYALGGLDGILWGTAISRFVNWLLMRRAVKAEAHRYNIPLVFRAWRQELRVLWHFSIPAALGGIMVIPVNWVCSAMLVNQPQGYAAMGAYNAANQWYNSLIFLPGMLGGALLPILSDRMGNGDGQASQSVLKSMVKLNAAIILPCVLVMSIFSQLIMSVYGHGYSEAWPTLIAVLCTAGVVAVGMPVGEVIAASGRMWLGLMMNSAWAVIYIAGTFFLLRWGSFGLAVSRLGAYTVQAIWALAFAYIVIRSQARAVEEPCAVQ
jgi:O-antigen/teichoic acid export membrane protein